MNLVEQIHMTSPWLRDPGWRLRDRHLLEVAKSEIHFQHMEEGVRFLPGTISIIRGSRQIGKSTECKLYVLRRLSEGTNPERIFYFPCDNLINRRELVTVMRSIRAISKIEPESKDHITVILDEITSVKQWYKTIKWMKDTGQLDRVALVLTGSSAYEMKRGYDRMPGRRGEGLDLCLLPMDFPDFVRALHPGQAGNLKISLDQMTHSMRSFESHKMTLLEQQELLSSAASLYMTFGGIPKVVSETARLGRPSDDTMGIYLLALSSEIEKQKRSTATLRQILASLYLSLCTPTSYTNIATKGNIPSAGTVKDYIEALHYSFVEYTALPLDVSKKTAFPKKNRKHFFADPVYAAALKIALHLPELEEGALAESAVGGKLIREYANQWASWGHVDSLFYWRSSQGKEIDFVVDREGYYGIEVKYQSRISGWDELSILRGIGKGLLVTRNHFEFGAVPKIPLWAFLMLDLS